MTNARRAHLLDEFGNKLQQFRLELATQIPNLLPTLQALRAAQNCLREESHYIALKMIEDDGKINAYNDTLNRYGQPL